MRFLALLLVVAGFGFLAFVPSNDAATQRVVARYDNPRLEQGTQDAYSSQLARSSSGNVQGLSPSDRRFRNYD